jgi:small subunit ribosomal protein S16
MPMYHIVSADSSTARSGTYLEVVGRYAPLQNPVLITLKEQRLFYWLKNGALPTDTVRSLLQRSGHWLKWSLVKRGVEETKIALEMEKWQMAQEEGRKRDEERKVRRSAARRRARKAKGSETAPVTAPEASQPASPQQA